LGSIIGAIAGKGKGAAIGAAIGTVVGGGAGAIIGNKMDKKAAEAAKIANAQVEKVTDSNGLTAVKVAFQDGILFDFNSSTLKATSMSELAQLANIINTDGTVDIAVIGHTDKVGSYDANQKVSANRANSVATYLRQCGVPALQFKQIQGVGYDQYDDAMTAAQNRRVDVYMYASKEMIQAAQAEIK
jgi:outer membrane protein OmpA-like peptidoglycan-associated protein